MCRLALFTAVAVLALVAPLPATPAAAGAPAGPQVPYEPPVEGPIVDPFRPPANQWDSGNRGVDYAPAPGTPVKSAADGEVVFAGSVGGQLHVVVLHADGIRTSYSFLQSMAVRRGDRVRQGQVVGTSGDRLHFGARAGDNYIDPTTLFASGPPKVFLVPDELRRPASEATERAGLARSMGSKLAEAARRAAKTGRAAGGRVLQEMGGEALGLIEEARGVAHYAGMTNPVVQGARLLRYTVAWYNHRHNCTPASVASPPLPERRVAVLVGSAGSHSGPGGSPVEAVDTAGMGYVDTVRFSYNGGSTAESPYGAVDTTADLREMGRRFNALLEQVHRDHPGEAVDIIAHGQGGLVARAGLSYRYDAKEARYPRVANLITLGTPHTGSEAATALQMMARSDYGETVQDFVDTSRITPFDVGGESVQQMSETSWFLTMLNLKRLPDGIRFTSIGDRNDLLVPAVHTAAPGARNAVVSQPDRLDAHGSLPGSEAGRREIALAAAGLPPTCESLGNMLADYGVSTVIANGEDAAGALLYFAGRRLDRYGVQPAPVSLPTRRKP